MNRRIFISVSTLGLFILLALLVSPTINHNADTPIIHADNSAFLQLNNLHYSFFNQFMIWMTMYGREVVWSMAIILLFVIGGWTGKKTAIVMTLAIIVLIPIGTAAKEIVARPRPIIPKSDFLLAADSEYSFPSGHAMIVSAGAASALALFRDSHKKLIISLALSVEAALVCLSRVYVGGHYPLDVLGGILLGVGIALLFIAVVKNIEIFIISIRKIVKKL
ncbi:MAG: phosphatase PAP2 family protein [Thermoproteota archaeon]|nr:phosphatase PAP2 family protein [Thermoproteota archaeon]